MLLTYLSQIDNPEDQNKFTLLYEEYNEKMFYFANTFLKDSYLAEDAVHEAFIVIIKNLHKIKEADCPQTRNYLFIIVKHISLAMINKAKKNGEIPVSDEDYIWEEDSGFNLEDEYISKISYDEIVSEIKNLPETYRDSVYLNCILEMDISEAAEALNINKETAKKRLQRGKKLLTEKLKKEAEAETYVK
jgi:RNA polymerase sigma-70 factor (ECF subfamily)